jgi:phytoene/squalene synthetase
VEFLSLEVSSWREELASSSSVRSVTYQEYNKFGLAMQQTNILRSKIAAEKLLFLVYE